ncbi:sensor domain-containing diguanylate cyclase [Geomesophilobacter sediminis]|uniref:Diguanylate cyclase n=1 Tax=Geomesophilobacter sediminis TaxID=2798584 RepID=A0A8J7S8H8_9BACT|nr:diguanylate cyclase [Geomesophilobacter sediminis]MBJ6726486.1 diguanylate cyclase [Geomesophilobacter sediminis]
MSTAASVWSGNIHAQYPLSQQTLALIEEKVREMLAVLGRKATDDEARRLIEQFSQMEQEKAFAEGVLASVGAGISVHDRELRIIYQNPVMVGLFGEHVGEKCHLAYSNREIPCFGCPIAACMNDGETRVEERRLTVQGDLKVMETVASPLRDGSGNIIGAVEMLRDITGRKSTEEKLTRLSNLYQTLSHTNKAILKIKSRDALFQEICRIAVKYGRFCLACIGLPDRATGLLRPVAFSGTAERYVRSLKVSIDESVQEGQGPTGRALRARIPYICNDFHADPTTAPWHESARNFGIAASATFPLVLEEGEVGALKVYSQEKGFFDKEMVGLLQEMAANISFALDNFALERKRAQTEQALQESEERLKLVLEGSRDGFWDWNVATGELQASARYFEILGFEPGEVASTAQAVRNLVHPEDWPALKAVLDEHLAGVTHAYEAEYRMQTKTGSWVWFLERGKVVARGGDGRALRVAGTCSDITERKYIEENLRYVSTHDSMTGLFNRAYFDTELDRVMHSRHYPVSIVIADVDGLKHVNDGFGHGEGDRLIKQAAQALREAFRAEDVIARIGGDEFAVILPDTDTDAVKEAVKRVRDYQARINEGENSDYTLSLSIGSATAATSADLLPTLKLADSRMYYYKFQRKARQ